MIDRGDASASKTILEAIALNSAHAYGMKPWTETDESFHRFVSRFLDVWARGNRPHFELVRLIGPRQHRRCFELRNALNRNGVAYGFYETGSSEGGEILESLELADVQDPVAVLVDGTVLVDPTNRELAEALDLTTFLDVTGVPVDEIVDVTVVGAGPAGLSTAVYAASEGLHTVVVEREAIGGQAGMSSRIRNYLGFPTGISGSELAQRAFQQAWLFGADFTFAQSAQKLEDKGDHKLLILSDGTPIRTRTVVLALGVSYRRLGLEGIDDLLGAGVFYGSPASEALAMRGHRVFVVGGGNSAGQAAVHLARFARNVTMLVREHSLAVYMSDYLVQEIARCDNIEVQLESEVVGGGGEGHLEFLMISDGSGQPPRRESAEALFVLIGAQPQTDWLPDSIERVGNGYIVTGEDLMDSQGNLPETWRLRRRPLPFETSLPGVFAAGDVRLHAIHRVASAVGEGAIAVHQLHQYLSD
jgi:thioredoxin reductase (NADPH)